MKKHFYEIVLPEIREVLKWIIPRGKGVDLAVSGRGKLSFLVFLIHKSEGFYDNLRKLILYISQRPSLRVEDVYKVVNAYEVKYVRPYDYEKYLLSQRNIGYKFYNYNTKITLNTPENRFLAFFVDRIIWDLEDILYRFESKVFKNELNEARKILRDFKFLRDFTFLQNFGRFPEFTVSERITHNPIYAKAFRMFLNYGGFITTEKNTQSLDKVLEDWRIFELYVFFRIKGIIQGVYGYPNKPPKLPRLDKEMPADEIFKNWTYEFNGLTLHYQLEIPRYKPYTRQKVFSTSLSLRPDVVIEKGDWLYIFDAKHKNSPEDSDYRQMHTYRDAIRKRISGKPEKRVRFAIMIVQNKDILEELKGGDILTKWSYIKNARVGYITPSRLRGVLKRLNIV
ncbi:MAG: DUF2357 domain-containing protein [candidate division WOR-3 bacterium]